MEQRQRALDRLWDQPEHRAQCQRHDIFHRSFHLSWNVHRVQVCWCVIYSMEWRKKRDILILIISANLGWICEFYAEFWTKLDFMVEHEFFEILVQFRGKYSRFSISTSYATTKYWKELFLISWIVECFQFSSEGVSSTHSMPTAPVINTAKYVRRRAIFVRGCLLVSLMRIMWI